eukprot:gene14722-16256_t
MAMTSFQAAKKIVWNEDRFSDGLMFAKLMLGVEKLFEDQVKSLRQFFHGKHLYFSAPTGYGKSLIFQAIPLIADHLLDKCQFTSSVLIISPLQSLMIDQVSKLKKLGICAVAIYGEQTEDVFKEIEEGGAYTHIYTSPESMLNTGRWRKFLASNTFQNDCVCVAFDEAHCIAQW